MEARIIGMQKRRIDRYREIVEVLLKKEELTAKQRDFLKKERLI